ncbi:MAG: amino acid ABC transporter permease [Propionibacteriales bacterium]|jgi:glutamate transport system permease protein|nr:amino acid ABC transporter permease [Propionibacteriales bacterium]
MSTVLFDAPGPRARRRHRLIAGVSSLLLLAAAYWVYTTFREEGLLTSTVVNDTFQNSNVTFLLEGFVSTLKAAALAIVGSVVFGAVFAIGRLSDHRVLRWPSTIVVEFFRAVPLVLLILGIWYGYKETIGTLMSLVLALTLYNGSVLAEVYRAGINAVPKGQSEASYALGMRKGQVMRMILMPQAVKFMLPAIISQCVIILKDTSLGFIILYPEVVRGAKQVANFVDDGTLLTFGTVAAVFILINYSMSKLAEYLERRLARRGERPIDMKAIESGLGQGAMSGGGGV